MSNRKHVVYVPKVGTHIDSNAFGGHYVTKEEQKWLIEEEKRKWRHTIKCPKQVKSICCMADKDTPYPHLKFEYVANPYFGWKEKQLKIVIR